MSASLIRPLTEELDAEGKLEIVRAFWQKSSTLDDLCRYREYLKYYKKELLLVAFVPLGEGHSNSTLALQTHAELLELAKTISQSRHLERRELHRLIQARQPQHSIESIKLTIDLAVRIWLTINIREERLQLQTPHTKVLQWYDCGEFQSARIVDCLICSWSTGSMPAILDQPTHP
jgi:hypothetical protein